MDIPVVEHYLLLVQFPLGSSSQLGKELGESCLHKRNLLGKLHKQTCECAMHNIHQHKPNLVSLHFLKKLQ